jgi:hypothetical protein
MRYFHKTLHEFISWKDKYIHVYIESNILAAYTEWNMEDEVQ